MNAKSLENLKTIRFEGELLPKWTQLLELAASLCLVPQNTRQWFSRFTNSSGVDDARKVINECGVLQASIQENKVRILAELQQDHGDNRPSQIVGAWMYALDTMIEEARNKKTCSWIIEGIEKNEEDGSEGGEISLRRV